MLRLLKIFFDIMLLKAGPQDLPNSRFLLQATLLLYFMAGTFTSLFSFPFLSALGVSLVDTTLLMTLILSALRVRNLHNRIPQTMIAVLGTLGLFSIISLPFNIWYANFAYTMEQSLDQLFTFIMLFLLIWSLSILGHILHHALNISSGMAMGLSLFYLTLSLFLTMLLFTTTTEAGGTTIDWWQSTAATLNPHYENLFRDT